jgi:hypothetical protein
MSRRHTSASHSSQQHHNYYKHPNVHLSLEAQHQAHSISLRECPKTTVDEKEQVAFYKQRDKQTRSVLETSIKFNPFNHEARLCLAQSMTSSSNRSLQAEAQHHTKIILKAQPSHAEAHYVQGLSHLQAQQPDKARHDFEQALLYDYAHRGALKVQQEMALVVAIKQKRDFVSQKIIDHTPDRLKDQLDFKSHKTKISCLLKATDALLNDDQPQQQPQQPQHHHHHQEREPYDGRHGMLPVTWTVNSNLGDMANVMPEGQSITEYYETGAHSKEIETMLVVFVSCLKRKLKRLNDTQKDRLNTVKAKEARVEAVAADKDKAASKRGKRPTKKRKPVVDPHPVVNYIAIDLDGTAFNGYQFMKKKNFQGLPPHYYSDYVLQEEHDANQPIVDFVRWVHSREDLKCLFVTERPVYSKHQTMKSLKNAGYEFFDDILWCASKVHEVEAKLSEGTKQLETSDQPEVEKPAAVVDVQLSHHPHYRYAGKTCRDLKERALRLFSEDKTQKVERRIVGIVGDQDSDFGNDEREDCLCVKLPNYLYGME